MIWVEVLGRHRDVVSRHLVGEAGLAVGRAYDNDLILDDPAVAPHHLVVRLGEDGGWVAEDRGSVNGLYREGTSTRETRLPLAGDVVLRVGRTLLRVRPRDYPVPPERALAPDGRHLALLVGLGAALPAMLLAATWLADVEPFAPSRYLTGVTMIVAFLAAWSGLWALVSRAFTGHAAFRQHLLVALAGFTAFKAVDYVWSWLAYAVDVPEPVAATTLAEWLVIGTTCYAHLRILGPGAPRLKALMVGIVAAAAFTTQVLVEHEAERKRGLSVRGTDLYPPAMRLAPGVTEEAFFAKAATLRAPLEAARTEPVPAGHGDF